MVDLLSVFFIIGCASLFLVLTLIFKNKMLALLDGLCFGVLAIYLFGRCYVGDPDVGQITWAFGWICVVATMVCWTMPFWMTGMKKEKVVKEPVVEEDYYDRIEKNTARIRKRRPKRSNPWGV